MEPRVSLVTLGVSNLKRAVAFYRDGLGWPKSELGGDEVAFFKTGGVVIALFPKASFAADAGVDVEHGGFSRVSLAHNVAEEEQVDAVLAEAAEAGATIVKEAQEIFFGRHGFFADPDGFLWEVAWNPFLPDGPGRQHRTAWLGTSFGRLTSETPYTRSSENASSTHSGE